MTVSLDNALTNTLDAYVVNGKIGNDRLIGGQCNDKIDGEIATTHLSVDMVTITFMEARVMMYLREGEKLTDIIEYQVKTYFMEAMV